MGESLTAVFIDYKVGFDSISHKFIDETLRKAGVSTKAKVIFRTIYTIYKAVSAYTTAQGTDGKQIKSDVFCIVRGALQGDMTSPLFFVLALELILR